ncbi:hypothetical protein [Roseateles noduli]|uniref:hypothetical protein n=1 Tax=Roseateles noduli TaxID=2052484 RepID=UPI003D649959
MDYLVGMHQVVVLESDHNSTERTIRRELERSLGGAAGVVEALLAGGRGDYGVRTAAGAASERWRDAMLAALDAAHLEFAALILRLAGDEFDEALADELVTVDSRAVALMEATPAM